MQSRNKLFTLIRDIFQKPTHHNKWWNISSFPNKIRNKKCSLSSVLFNTIKFIILKTWKENDILKRIVKKQDCYYLQLIRLSNQKNLRAKTENLLISQMCRWIFLGSLPTGVPSHICRMISGSYHITSGVRSGTKKTTVVIYVNKQ